MSSGAPVWDQSDSRKGAIGFPVRKTRQTMKLEHFIVS
jgi:hypothetical protein